MNNIQNNKINIINTIKILLYKENPSLLEKVNFDDDDVFLEPLLFSYLNSKKQNLFSSEILEEIMQGYFKEQKNVVIKHTFNINNISYIPKVGYFDKNKRMLEPILELDHFEIIKEIHPVLEKYFVEYYRGHIKNQNPVHNSVWEDNYIELKQAITILKEYLPEFYKEFLFANRKIYLHDNSKILNFTSLESLGLICLYVLGRDNILYYIEELIHQGSHNFLEYVMYQKKDFFKIDSENSMMKTYTKQDWDYRDIYGAFHGLYTVTRRVECFDMLLSKNIFSGKEKHELLGRLTDQFSRFRTGLELLDINEIYTEKGADLYRNLDYRCEIILEKHQYLKDTFDMSNRDLDFRYEDFCKLNPIENFYNKDSKNYFIN